MVGKFATMHCQWSLLCHGKLTGIEHGKYWVFQRILHIHMEIEAGGLLFINENKQSLFRCGRKNVDLLPD